jgi:hypothetical protein
MYYLLNLHQNYRFREPATFTFCLHTLAKCDLPTRLLPINGEMPPNSIREGLGVLTDSLDDVGNVLMRPRS